MKKLKHLLTLSLTLLLSACGFHFANDALSQKVFNEVQLDTGDKYSDISMAMKKELRLRGVTLVEQGNVPILRLNGVSTGDTVASVFKQGREAESLLTLSVSASLQMPDKKRYPINVQVSRTFFDNSRAALAKNAEQRTIWNDMYRQAAQQIMIKMISIQQQY
ncbi:hypothetical protein QV08_04235 [Gallibacterium salpingitidis]|uniref:LPS-assembly lipoprotein LptE n=1 Tax=Gallibacterium salpingitidis TaxID=505341 RepID=A0A1A7Q0Q3_9PAST|nr:LPS assembly lipoprotein LptE [Gallibacterium salpingitidis]OBW95357.1 hypothetical protein QS62_03005 [Gallibacterium salpingitidis]OBX08423.1 hypothetical protein QV08_04235 [Gallibacterium salpingitidis]OBX09181.1 hypothetical protein QV09_08500 [Gallibacterium salpingitidis]WKS99137.1 LPS assembly lipoprotein LptE [Gallibacterium salpingitidis]